MNRRLIGSYLLIICISLQSASCRKISHSKKYADDRSSPDDELSYVDTSEFDESRDTAAVTSDTDTSGVTRDTDTAGNREFTVEDYVDFGRAMCDFYERCDSSVLADFKDGTFASCLEFFECEAKYASSLSKFMAPVFSMTECTSILEKADCAETDPEHPELLCSLVEIVAEGEACPLNPYLSSVPQICETGTQCAAVSFDEPENPRCGVCRRYRTLNEKCDLEEDCGIGLYCSFDFKCEPEKEPGEPCSWGQECSSKQCGLDSLCVKYGEVGDHCDDNSMEYCDDALACVNGKCEDPLADLGEACSFMVGCRVGLECIEGRCEELECELRKIGENCHPALSIYCVTDAQCSPDTFTCVPVGMPGESCASNTDCADWLFCDIKTSACKLKKLNGESCTVREECRSAYCDKEKGVCAVWFQC